MIKLGLSKGSSVLFCSIFDHMVTEEKYLREFGMFKHSPKGLVCFCSVYKWQRAAAEPFGIIYSLLLSHLDHFIECRNIMSLSSK